MAQIQSETYLPLSFGGTMTHGAGTTWATNGSTTL